MTIQIDDISEWLEADGRGGFASGTVSGVRTRRYHAILLSATTPPTGRVVLVNGFDAMVDTAAGSFALTTQRYAPDVLHPDGASRLRQFQSEPWPAWTYELPDGTTLLQELLVEHERGTTLISWSRLTGHEPITLRVRPLLSGRDYHSTHHENGAFRFTAEQSGAALTFTPYDGVPAIGMRTTGEYREEPTWYRQFLYTAERERGLDSIEDLASPGELTWTLNAAGDRAIWMLESDVVLESPSRDEVAREFDEIRARELKRRSEFASPLDRAADAYVVSRGAGQTIIAGYPWFTDWGRDTFIAIRGLCLATGRFEVARDILVEWSGAVSEGMLPNRFPDSGEAPEFNAVDASLWFVIAAAELLQAVPRNSTTLSDADRDRLQRAILAIVSGYAAGTRFGIRMDDDGLLAAGVPGVQLTWMDARVGDHVITPRIGKPVEVQALWLNALAIASKWDDRWAAPLDRGRAAFVAKFWDDGRGCLADVVDVDHQVGTRDDTFRPNQILAVGGLPLSLVDGVRARRIVDAVERRLVTPIGLRSLAPGEPGYAPRYEGDSAERDSVYHQGTVWPWLMGPFVDAWLRVRRNTEATRKEARARFLDPLMAHLQTAGLGHVSEIADAEAPFTPRGCPFQAWSLGELLRIDRVILAPPAPSKRRREPTAIAV